MSTPLAIFEKEAWRVRVFEDAGKHWFVAKDACKCLGIRNVADACANLDDDERNTIVLNDSIQAGNPTTLIITESGLYALIFKSRKPEAESFRRWIRKEVLPEIARTGGYSLVSDKRKMIDASQLELEIDGLKDRVSHFEKRASFYEKKIASDRKLIARGRGYLSTDRYMSMNEASCFITQHFPEIEIGGKRLFQKLRDYGYVGKCGNRRRLPTQKGLRTGFLRQQTTNYVDKKGRVMRGETTFISEAGAVIIADMILSETNRLCY